MNQHTRQTLLFDLGNAAGAVSLELLNSLSPDARVAVADAVAMGSTMHMTIDVEPLQVRLLMRDTAGQVVEIGRVKSGAATH